MSDRVTSKDFRELSRESLVAARWNRIHRSASLRERLKELKDELMCVRSELHEIEHLLATGKQPPTFPAPVIEKPAPYERPLEKERREARSAKTTKRASVVKHIA